MISEDIFVGREAEGPGMETGEMTLFIPYKKDRQHDYKKIKNAISKYSIKRLYFGAGDKRGFDGGDEELLNWLKRQEVLQYFSVFVEIDSFDQLKNIGHYFPYKVEVIFVVDVPEVQNKTYLFDHFKIVTSDTVLWFSVKDTFVNLKSDPIYLKDIKL